MDFDNNSIDDHEISLNYNGMKTDHRHSNLGKEEREHSLTKLRLDIGYETPTSQRAISGGHSIPNVDGLADRSDPAPSWASGSNTNHHVSYGSSSNHLLGPESLPRGPQPLQLQQLPPLSQTVKMEMYVRVEKAMAEVIRLLRDEAPLWIKSSSDGRLVTEISKEVVVVKMDAENLLRMFVNLEKWERLFPTIVKKARSIHALESRHTQGQIVAILIYEQLHILSTLVHPREFMFLRGFHQKEENTWVIADVSYNLPYFPFEYGAPTCFKRLSGYLIQALPNGFSKVTWMEHIEVDNRMPTHELYRDLLSSGSGFGARRWTTTLQRMCERLSLSSISDFPTTDNARGRRCIMALGERMMRDFTGILKVSSTLEFSQLLTNHNGVIRFFIRENKGAGTPTGFIACATSSFSVPIPSLRLFNFLNNLDIRHQWDVLCHGKLYKEAVAFATGADHRNCVTILQPSKAMKETSELRIIQESFVDALGGMMVYAPLDLDTANSVVSGQVDPSNVLILPSGFIVSHGGRSSAADDSLLTVAIQILAHGPNYSEDAACARALLISTVLRIKATLNADDDTHDQ